jgi:hypothetical protein
MNNLNYASLEASKKLHDAGIVLETECFCCRDNDGWYFRDDENSERDILETIPNPSMSEVWRELPADVEVDGEKYNLCAHKIGGVNCAEYVSDLPETIGSAYGANMADNLIDLLIWVKEEEGK